MKYFKLTGSVWDTYFSVDEENCVCNAVEVRFTDNAKGFVETYVVATYSTTRGTYDALAIEEVKGYETISAAEWKRVKKDFTDYMKEVA